jgi:hypothetical protein
MAEEAAGVQWPGVALVHCSQFVWATSLATLSLEKQNFMGLATI